MNDEELERLLREPALWMTPAPDLEERIVASIADEVARTSTPSVAPLKRGRRRRYLLAGLAAAAAIVFGIGLAVGLSDDDATLEAALDGTELATGASGGAELTKTPGGWRIEIDATGLPRRDGSSFYEAWLKSVDGTLVSIGTFNEPRDVILWAGVSPRDFPTLTITRETTDGDPASSGEVVLSGVAQEGS